MNSVGRYTKIVRKHDRALYAVDAGSCLQIHRKADSIHQTFFSSPMNQYVLSLTDNWKPDGNPVEWGEVPLLEMLSSMDTWRSSTDLGELRQRRERDEELRKNSIKNEIRARAADLRKDFARATNDINTSTVDMVDRRRMKDGNC